MQQPGSSDGELDSGLVGRPRSGSAEGSSGLRIPSRRPGREDGAAARSIVKGLLRLALAGQGAAPADERPGQPGEGKAHNNAEVQGSAGGVAFRSRCAGV